MDDNDMLKFNKYKGDQINFELVGMKGIPASIVNRGYKGYPNYGKFLGYKKYGKLTIW